MFLLYTYTYANCTIDGKKKEEDEKMKKIVNFSSGQMYENTFNASACRPFTANRCNKITATQIFTQACTNNLFVFELTDRTG